MGQEYAHQPIILLLDRRQAAGNGLAKQWFKKSRFLTCEAIDVFQALEEISDFTLRFRPDIVLLEGESLREDFFIIREIFHASSGGGEPLIFALSESGKKINHKECFEGNLAELRTRLDKIIPKHRSAAA